MTTDSKTATPAQGALIVGTVLAIAAILGITVLPMFHPPRSKLVGFPAPDFTLPVITNGEAGSRMHLADLRGKAVVIDFWASWCAPCRAEAPIVDRVARRHEGKGVVVLGVATSGDDWRRAEDFVKTHVIGYPSLFDENDHTANDFRIEELPTLVVLNAAGVITAVRPRMVHEDELEELVTSALSDGTKGS